MDISYSNAKRSGSANQDITENIVSFLGRAMVRGSGTNSWLSAL